MKEKQTLMPSLPSARWVFSWLMTLTFFLLLPIANAAEDSGASETKQKPKPKAATRAAHNPDQSSGTVANSIIFGVQFGGHFVDSNQRFGGFRLRDRESYHLRFGYALIDHLDLDVSGSFVPNRAGAADVHLYTLHGGLVGNLFARHWWTPFVGVGLGLYALDNPGIDIYQDDLSIAYGGGFKFFFYDHVALIFEGRGISTFDDVTNFNVSGGLIAYAPLKKQPKDPDHDGIIGKADSCPNDPEDFDGFQDADGCPEADNDRDGIIDSEDQCPMEPEDIDGFQDRDGCPEGDNDKDGILDAQDKCPNEAEDKDGFEDEDGCPDLDNDKDGIADADDQCPMEPETKNDFLDEDGCPDEKLKKFSGVMQGIKFAFNSTIIDLTSYPLLNQVAEAMKEYKESILVIEGHTDSVGSAAYNKNLSRQRCESVRQYLVSRDVSPFRIRIAPYGEERPVASNNTETGRMLNRRIEFRFETAKDVTPPKQPMNKKEAPAKKQ